MSTSIQSDRRMGVRTYLNTLTLVLAIMHKHAHMHIHTCAHIHATTSMHAHDTGSFRFFLLRMLDRQNCRQVLDGPSTRPVSRGRAWDKNAAERLRKHNEAKNRRNDFPPNLPDLYITGTDLAFNVVSFKNDWIKMSKNALMIESKAKQSKMDRVKKFKLRRMLCDHVVKKKWLKSRQDLPQDGSGGGRSGD